MAIFLPVWLRGFSADWRPRWRRGRGRDCTRTRQYSNPGPNRADGVVQKKRDRKSPPTSPRSRYSCIRGALIKKTCRGDIARREQPVAACQKRSDLCGRKGCLGWWLPWSGRNSRSCFECRCKRVRRGLWLKPPWCYRRRDLKGWLCFPLQGSWCRRRYC